jgi:ATP-binding protein involved in chromosome partitioning
MITNEQVVDALRTVQDPELGEDLVSLGMIRDIRIEGDKVQFTVVLTTPACPLGMEFQERCVEAVRRLPAVREVSIKMTADVGLALAPEQENLVPTVKNVAAWNEAEHEKIKSSTRRPVK